MRRSPRTTHRLGASVLFLALAPVPFAAHSADDPIAAEMSIEGGIVVMQTVPVANFTVMNVRLFNPEGRLVFSARSTGEAVLWSPRAYDPDGRYRFEAVTVTYDPALDSGVEDGPNGERLIRLRGGFVVEGGVVTSREGSGKDETNPKQRQEP